MGIIPKAYQVKIRQLYTMVIPISNESNQLSTFCKIIGYKHSKGKNLKNIDNSFIRTVAIPTNLPYVSKIPENNQHEDFLLPHNAVFSLNGQNNKMTPTEFDDLTSTSHNIGDQR